MAGAVPNFPAAERGHSLPSSRFIAE